MGEKNMSIPLVDPLPPAPTPADPEPVFDDKAYEMVAALAPFVEQTNALALAVEAEATRSESEADRSQAQVNVATTEANRAQTEAERAKYEADRAEQARDDAVVVVTDGQGSLTPAPGKFPVAGADAAIKQAWIKGLEFELDALRVARNKLMYGDGPYPVLDSQFQGAKYLDPRITFTRASKDWDWDGNEYGIDEPVITDQGLWLWGSRANLCKYSSDISEWDKIKVKVDRDGVPSPRLYRVSLLTDTPNALNDRVELLVGYTPEQSASFSFLVAKGTTTTVGFAISTRNVAGRIATINLDTLDVTGEGHYGKIEVTPVGGGLYRVFCVVDSLTSGITYMQFFPRGLVDGDFAFFGDVQATLDGMLSPTIPTNGSQVTVIMSNLAVQDDNLNINSGGGIVVKYSVLKEPNDLGFAFRLGSVGQASNYIGVDYLTASSYANQSYYRSGGDFYINTSKTSPLVVGDVRVSGFSWSSSKVIDATNGETRIAEFSHVPPVNGNLTVGQLGSKSNGSRIGSLSLLIKNLTVFDASLTAEQLQELTR